MEMLPFVHNNLTHAFVLVLPNFSLSSSVWKLREFSLPTKILHIPTQVEKVAFLPCRFDLHFDLYALRNGADLGEFFAVPIAESTMKSSCKLPLLAIYRNASGDPAGIRTPDPLLKRQLLCLLSYRIMMLAIKLPVPTAPYVPRTMRQRYEFHPKYAPQVDWLGRLDLNQRMRESKSLALPLGYAPI